MTRLIQSLSEIAASYDALFCDLWGCLHNGVTPFPEAVAALKGFRAGGGKVVLLTNAPRPRAAVIAQLDRLGVPREAWDTVVTSGEAAQAGMMAGLVGHRIHHIGADKDESFFSDIDPELLALGRVERVPLAEAEGIVCTGLVDDLTETPEDYRATLLYAKAKGLKLLCANPDIIVDMGDKRVFCAGAIAQLYTEMGGESLYFGKPWPPIYDLARRRLAAIGGTDSDGQVLCVGDGVTTDIQGGMSEGFDTLFVTGGISASAFGPDSANPDTGLLEAWFAQKQLDATWSIAALR